MNKDWKEVHARTLAPQEIEKMLQQEFGDKLQPLDRKKLAEQQLMRQRYQNGEGD